MTDTDARLKSFIERVERLEEEKAGIAADIKEVFAEAKATGFDPKIMRIIIRLRKMEQADRQEQEELVELYEASLGMRARPTLDYSWREPVVPQADTHAEYDRTTGEIIEQTDSALGFPHCRIGEGAGSTGTSHLAEGERSPAAGESPATDPYDRAVAIVTESQKASTSYVQRILGLSYNAAARLIERMEAEGIVSHPNREGKRECLISPSGAADTNTGLIAPEVQKETDTPAQAPDGTALGKSIMPPVPVQRHTKIDGSPLKPVGQPFQDPANPRVFNYTDPGEIPAFLKRANVAEGGRA